MASDQVIELDVVVQRNRNLFFTPTQEVLRTEMRLENQSGKTEGRLQQVGGVIPGMRIVIDRQNCVGKLVDRMHLDENTELDKQIRQVINTDTNLDQREFGDYSQEPIREIRLGDDPPHNLATWLFWARRYLDSGKVRVVKGTVPEMSKIRDMGTIFTGDSYNLQPPEGKLRHNYLYPPTNLVTAGA